MSGNDESTAWRATDLRISQIRALSPINCVLRNHREFLGMTWAGRPAIIRDCRTPAAETESMDLPIKFPSDADVIAEETARFRALSPEERMRSICNLLEAGALMMRQSPKAAFLQEYTRQQEELAQRNIKEFIARHAR